MTKEEREQRYGLRMEGEGENGYRDRTITY